MLLHVHLGVSILWQFGSSFSPQISTQFELLQSTEIVFLVVF
jgi:hypothetical protein